MPVIRRKPDTPDLGRYEPLIQALTAELTRPEMYGQPLIEEQELPRSGMFETNVYWNEWQGVPDRDRPAVIQQAYRRGRSGDVDKLAFAAGYTFPEAAEAELLPFSLTLSPYATLPADVRRQVEAAVQSLGGRTPADGGLPTLRLPSMEWVVACRDEFVRRFPSTQRDWMSGDHRRNGELRPLTLMM